MGLKLQTINGRVEPRELRMILLCDAVFCDGPARPVNFEQSFYGRSFIECYNLALAAGWTEGRSPLLAGVFYCPWCSGKKKNGPVRPGR